MGTYVAYDCPGGLFVHYFTLDSNGLLKFKTTRTEDNQEAYDPMKFEITLDHLKRGFELAKRCQSSTASWNTIRIHEAIYKNYDTPFRGTQVYEVHSDDCTRLGVSLERNIDPKYDIITLYHIKDNKVLTKNFTRKDILLITHNIHLTNPPVTN